MIFAFYVTFIYCAVFMGMQVTVLIGWAVSLLADIVLLLKMDSDKLKYWNAKTI
jgi:hypothetical protein